MSSPNKKAPAIYRIVPAVPVTGSRPTCHLCVWVWPAPGECRIKYLHRMCQEHGNLGTVQSG